MTASNTNSYYIEDKGKDTRGITSFDLSSDYLTQFESNPFGVKRAGVYLKYENKKENMKNHICTLCNREIKGARYIIKGKETCEECMLEKTN